MRNTVLVVAMSTLAWSCGGSVDSPSEAGLPDSSDHVDAALVDAQRDATGVPPPRDTGLVDATAADSTEPADAANDAVSRHDDMPAVDAAALDAEPFDAPDATRLDAGSGPDAAALDAEPFDAADATRLDADSGPDAALDSSTAIPRAYVDSLFSGGASSGTCNAQSATGPGVGAIPGGGGSVERAADGSSSGLVSVACAVEQSDAGYCTVDLAFTNATSSPQAGSFHAQGQVTSSFGANIAVSMTSQGVAFTESDCTLSLSSDGFEVSIGAPPAPPHVAPGRIWGTLTCPDLVASGDAGTACILVADVVFENCQE